MLFETRSQRATYVALALVVLGLCNSTNYGNNSVDAQELLYGAQQTPYGNQQVSYGAQPGAYGAQQVPYGGAQQVSYGVQPTPYGAQPAYGQDQTNVMPTATGDQYVADKIVVNQNEQPAVPSITIPIPVFKREAPSAPVAAAVDSAKQQVSAAQTDSATFGDKLKEQLNMASQQVQKYSDQLAAQIPKRVRRQAQFPQVNPIGSGLLGQQQQPPLLQPQTPLFGAGPSSQLTAFTDQVRDQAGAAVQQMQNAASNLRDQVVGSVTRLVETPPRVRRQVQYPNLDQQNRPTEGGSGVLKYLSDLGQQAQQAQAISQLFSAAGASGAQGPGASSPLTPTSGQQAGSTGLATVAQMMSQLTDLIKSTQDRNARVLESNQRGLEAANQQTFDAATTTQGRIQAAITEMGQGLQKLAANNPNLLPDIKRLYQSVATRLSSATQTPGQQPPPPPPSPFSPQPQPLAPSLPVPQP